MEEEEEESTSQREEGGSNVLGRRPTLLQSNQNPQNISKVDEEEHPPKNHPRNEETIH
jgi:hypothetical protein